MKKLIVALLIVATMLAMAVPALAASKVYTTGSVNLRKGPGLDYATLGSVTKGTSLKYLGKSSKDDRGVRWYKVSFNGKSAWISSKYSTLKKSGSGSSSVPKPKTSAKNKVTTTGSVNLRSGPGLGYKKIVAVQKGSTLKYLGKTSTDSRGVKWYKVSYNGKTAWISSRYSKLSKKSSSSSSTKKSTATAKPKATATPAPDYNPFEAQPDTTITPDLTGDVLETPKPTLPVVGSKAPSDYVEVSDFYGSELIGAAVMLGIDGYRTTETEVPKQYYNDALTIGGDSRVSYIGLRAAGYSVYGVCVGMDIEDAKKLLTEAGLNLYDSSWIVVFQHPAGEDAMANLDGYDSCINIYTNTDGKVTELDWSTYTN